MPRENLLLFGVPANELRWGIAPGEHVCHLFKTGKTKAVEVKYDDPEAEPSGYEKVSQTEMYNNEADSDTAEFFTEMASNLERDFKDEALCEGVLGKEYVNMLESYKNYLTSGRRATQQKALTSLKKNLENLSKKVQERLSGGQISQEERAALENVGVSVSYYSEQLTARTIGNRDMQKGTLPDPLTEPDNTYSGKVGVWVKTDDELFPHIPSPNDIKQGYGVEDCYMLSAVAVKAAKDPSFIKNMMKDNGDGTVTVMFYDKDKKPVPINVIKSVNKGPVGNNVYAAGSLWVQMLEKAYATYQTLTSEGVIKGYSSNSPTSKVKGMKSIDRGTTDGFLYAIDKEETAYTGSGRTPICNSFLQDFYDFDGNGKKKLKVDREKGGYLRYEEELFDFYKKKVNDEKEIMTVGSTSGKGIGKLLNSDQDAFLKKHGIRTGHAYGIMKLFEKDGKKFVQLRDPYGTFKAEYGKDGKLKQNSYGPTAGGATMLEGMSKAGMDDMGTFNLEFVDFLTYFKNFSGVKQSTINEMSRITNGKIKEYEKDFFERAKPYTKEQEENALKDLSAEEKVIYDKLTNDPEGLKRNMNYRSNELKVTDEFFTWPNSSDFNKMRDQTYKLNSAMSKYDHLGASLEQKIKLVKEFTKMNTLADKYQKKKTEDLKKLQLEGKTPSARFIHRLTAAMNLRRIYNNEEMIPDWDHKKSEQMNIVFTDIKEKIKKMNDNLLPDVTNKEKERMQEVVDIIDRTINNKPLLAEEAKIDPNEVREVKQATNDFEVLDQENEFVQPDNDSYEEIGDGIMTF